MTSQRTRVRLVERLREKGISDERVLVAMLQVPRHLFVDEALSSRAYEDIALPIGHGQTISQPYIVAKMTQATLFQSGEPVSRVLEIGTGSGYQAALLSRLTDEVYTVERIADLRHKAIGLLRKLGYHNIRVGYADGTFGWAAHAPFDAIVVTAAPERVPAALPAQLKIGGRIVIPVGAQGRAQALLQLTRTADGLVEEWIESVSFVPFLSGTVVR